MRVDGLRFALLVRRIIKNAHRRHIHHDAFVGRRRQHELRRHHHLATDAGQPRVDAGICQQDFLIAHIEAACDVGQRVLLADGGLLHITHDIAVRIDFEAMGGLGFGNSAGGGGSTLTTGGGGAGGAAGIASSRRRKASAKPRRQLFEEANSRVIALSTAKSADQAIDCWDRVRRPRGPGENGAQAARRRLRPRRSIRL